MIPLAEGEHRYFRRMLFLRSWSRFSEDPSLKRIRTSIMERQNLAMRMQIRRLNRLTKAFSKKW